MSVFCECCVLSGRGLCDGLVPQHLKRATTTHKLMNKPIRNRHPLIKIANGALVDLPTPSTIRG
jgi:hypothetical protein